MLEALFGIAAPAPKKNELKKPAGSTTPQVAILESRKAHNFSIQLRGLRLTKHEVIGALLEGSFSSFLSDDTYLFCLFTSIYYVIYSNIIPCSHVSGGCCLFSFACDCKG
jgi:hypothetical protein